MKPPVLLFCLVFGHNKILEVQRKNGYSKYYTLCTQCKKRWFNKQLSDKPKIQFKNLEITMRAQAQKIAVKPIPKVNLQKN